MSQDNLLTILVLSCDKYSDLWEDFFNLKEKFWPDCPFKTFLATDSKEFNRSGVEVLHFGNIRDWTTCASEALKHISTPYVCLFLEDAFIYKSINTSDVLNDLKIVIDNKISFLTLERDWKIKNPIYYSKYIIETPPNRKWGIDTSAAIWDKSFLNQLLLEKECSAWEFEVNLCKKASSELGLPGKIAYDIRQPLNISPVEVVRLGKITPDSIIFFKKIGYNIKTSEREVLSNYEMFIYNLKARLAKSPFSGIIKQFAKILGFKFFT